jgi:hypothetical protein
VLPAEMPENGDPKAKVTVVPDGVAAAFATEA